MKNYDVCLPRLFSDILIHDGVPELGTIDDYNQTKVFWKLNEREIFAILSDAKDVLTRQRYISIGDDVFYHPSNLRNSAQRAIDTLEVFINENHLKFQVP